MPVEVLFCDFSFLQSELRHEVARVLGWASDDVKELGNHNLCDVDHVSAMSCSCEIAREVEKHGLFSSLHCRFEVDGSNCQHADCPYSHAEIQGVCNQAF